MMVVTRLFKLSSVVIVQKKRHVTEKIKEISVSLIYSHEETVTPIFKEIFSTHS